MRRLAPRPWERSGRRLGFGRFRVLRLVGSLCGGASRGRRRGVCDPTHGRVSVRLRPEDPSARPRPVGVCPGGAGTPLPAPLTGLDPTVPRCNTPTRTLRRLHALNRAPCVAFLALCSVLPAFAQTPAGADLAFASDRTGDWELYVYSWESGEQRQVLAFDGSDFHPTWAPDGSQLAFFHNLGDSAHIYSVGVDGDGLRRLTEGDAVDKAPDWSTDGAWIAFSSDRAGSFDLWRMRPDGSDLQRLTDHPGTEKLPAWSPDGRRIAFSGVRDGNTDVFLLDTETGAERRVTTQPFADCYATWSPDGRRLVYAAQNATDFDIVSWDVELATVSTLVDTDVDEAFPAWSPDGTRLAYQYETSRGTWAIAVADGDGTNTAPLIESVGWDTKPAWRPANVVSVAQEGRQRPALLGAIKRP